MKSIIDSIYDGDIRPAEDILLYSDELRRMYSQSAEILTVIDPEVMNKPTRLGNAERDILHRIETAQLMLRLKALTEPDKRRSGRTEQTK